MDANGNFIGPIYVPSRLGFQVTCNGPRSDPTVNCMNLTVTLPSEYQFGVTGNQNSYPSDGSILSQIMNDPALANNWTRTMNSGSDWVTAATVGEAGLTTVAFTAPAAVTGATTVYGWGTAVYLPTATLALGSQADTELAALEDGVSRLNVSLETYSYLNNMGQWWTYNQAVLDAHAFLGGRFIFVTDPGRVWSGSWYLNELQYLNH